MKSEFDTVLKEQNVKLEVLSMVKETIVNNRIKILGVLFLMLLLLFAYLVYQSISLNYLPVFSDEYGYYLDVKAFWLYDRIDAAITLNERYSLIGDAGFHGFMYNLLYGAFFKLFALLGITPSIMLANYVLILLLFLLLISIKMRLEDKLLVGILFLSNFIFIIYLSSSMTEIFHYSIAVVAAYLIYLIYDSGESRYINLLIVLVFIMIFFRESWVFLLFGLFLLVKSWRDFAKYSAILFLGLVVVILCQKYFQAAYPIDYFHGIKSQLGSSSLMDTLYPIYEHFLVNIDKYFISEAYERYRFVFYYKYLFVLVLLYALFIGLWSRDKAILSSALVAAVFFSSLLVLYDPFGWREVRALAVPFVLLTVVLILKRKYFAVSLIILFQLFNLNAVLDAKQGVDQNRQKMNVLIEESQPLLNDFLDLDNYVSSFDKNEIIVLMNWDLLPFNNSPIIYQLPLSLSGKKIRYSYFYRHFDILDSICDIYISNKIESAGNMKLIGNNKNFYFYRRVD
ncbi:MAG: hypothetical protein U9R26_05780, partial [Campylobacterota bacterium]|nr:hypothetical protein [Campylobacterota bacterium]